MNEPKPTTLAEQQAFVAKMAPMLADPPPVAARELAALLLVFLRSHADGGTVDTGMGLGACDFWLKIDGRALTIQLRGE